MSRGHQRKACFGGSSGTADPLIAELMESASTAAAHSMLAPLYESSPSRRAEMPDVDEPADLDEQLLIAARDLGLHAAERADTHHAEVSVHASILDVMRRVQLPTVHALRTESLKPLRAAIRATREEDDALLWAALHIILGAALRLRSHRKSSHQRAQALIEASRAFDSAYSIYAPLQTIAIDDALEELAADQAVTFRQVGCRVRGPCSNDRDGTMLVARAVAGPVGSNRRLLERAVTCLRLARAGADIKSWTWVSSTNNLACALTLLGNRSPAAAGSAMLREATQVLHEALKAHAAGYRREDRASTLINLAEALLSLAERETPPMRLKKIERAFTASSAALMTVIPPELAWLVKLEHRELA